MSKTSTKSKGLTLTDILVTIVIAAVFGVIYKLWGPMYDVVKPFGTHAEQLVYGMWFIAGTLAFLIIRKPGVAILAEVAAATVSALLGAEWGVATLIYGLAQGLGAEIFFALFRYRTINVFVASLAAVGAAAASLIVDNYYGYIEFLSAWNLSLLIILRVLGSIIIAGIFAYALSKALEKTGVTHLLRPVSKKDYDTLG
ncbi:ECF transporter S component [Paenibacillus sp. sgz302251]|uniref:ECF transporter S component n=1 Tax=Paenibacillus sp. sgz302251 TaxID=3414493 RepID=UPI003C79BC14